MEKNIDFGRIDKTVLEAVVGRPVLDMQIHNKKVICNMGGLNTSLPNNHTGIGGDIRVHFRKW